MGNAEARLAPNTKRRHNARTATKAVMQEIMKTYDKSKTGVLSRQEVKAMAAEISGNLELEFDDIDAIMMAGGATVKPEITAEELPQAVAVIISIKEEREDMLRLFKKYDVDLSGNLSASQLKPLLKEVNDGVEPSDDDVAYILRQCEPYGVEDPIKANQLQVAIQCWYCLAEDGSATRQKADEERSARQKAEEDAEAAAKLKELKEKQKKKAAAQKKKAAEEKRETQAKAPEREQPKERQKVDEADKPCVDAGKTAEEQSRIEKALDENASKSKEEPCRTEVKHESHEIKAGEAGNAAAELPGRASDGTKPEERQLQSTQRSTPEARPEPQRAGSFLPGLLESCKCAPCAADRARGGQDIADAEVPITAVSS